MLAPLNATTTEFPMPTSLEIYRASYAYARQQAMLMAPNLKAVDFDTGVFTLLGAGEHSPKEWAEAAYVHAGKLQKTPLAWVLVGMYHQPSDYDVTRYYECAAWTRVIRAPAGDYPVFASPRRGYSPAQVAVKYRGPVTSCCMAPLWAGNRIPGTKDYSQDDIGKVEDMFEDLPGYALTDHIEAGLLTLIDMDILKPVLE